MFQLPHSSLQRLPEFSSIATAGRDGRKSVILLIAWSPEHSSWRRREHIDEMLSYNTNLSVLFRTSYLRRDNIVSLQITTTYYLTSSHRMPYKPAIFCWNSRSETASKRAFRFLHVLAGSLVNTSPVAYHWAIGLTWIHASVSRSPWSHGSVAADKKHWH